MTTAPALLTPAALAEIRALVMHIEPHPDNPNYVTDTLTGTHARAIIPKLLSHAAAQAERIAALEHEVDKRECWIVVRKAQDAMAPDTQARIARLRAVAVAAQPHFMDGHLPLGDPVGDALAALQPGDLGETT